MLASCGLLRSKEFLVIADQWHDWLQASVKLVDDILIICCNLLFQLPTQIGSKIDFLHLLQLLSAVNMSQEFTR